MVIYKITNLKNNKIYIGQTVNFEERKRHHLEIPFRKNSKEKNKPLYRAMLKYGIENFTFKIIDKANSIEELNEKEIFWIGFLDSTVDNGKGYNLDKGGKNGLKSEETKKKMSKSQRGENNPAYGKAYRATRCINLTKGVVYNSMLECALKEYGDRTKLKQISKVCDENSNRFSYRGNEYRKLDEEGNIVEKNTEKIKNVYSLRVKDLLSGREFGSVKEASEYFGISSSAVRDRIYNRVKNDKFKDKFILVICD